MYTIGKFIAGIGLAVASLFGYTQSFGGTSVFQYFQGGTGTTTAPVSQVIYAGSSSYQSVATSTLTATSPLTGSLTQLGSGGTLGCQTASGAQAGCLSSADWTTFNNKGSGSVTSVATNNGLTGGTITTTGTVGLDITKLSTNALITWNGTQLQATGTPQLNVGNIVATSTTASSYILKNLGIGTTTPPFGLTASSTIFSYESTEATSTTQTIDFSNSNQSLIRIGGVGVTVTFTNLVPGVAKRVVVCNPSGTAGAVTWPVSVMWSGGTLPTQTTTAQKCDVWSFIVTQATSTVKVFGAFSANF